ncbi:MAG TPA: DUF5915 domain-containing protein, partial [Candidatus Edwardsbacteria bacterium]|nr:DUF5915 domain-containing protein [Candidatus Edwardsbacteria bacterium]
CTQNPVQTRNFGYHVAAEFKRKLLTLHNVYSFYITYAELDGFAATGRAAADGQLSLLDKWILSELNLLVRHCRAKLDDYDAAAAVKRIETFIEDLSTWYVRRSRRRFWKSESDADKQAAYLTLHDCLETLLRLMAPVMPFWTEEMYQNLVRSADPAAPQSVHLCAYPEADQRFIDAQLSTEMALVRKVVSLGHAARKDAKLKVRQPLAQLLYKGEQPQDWEIIARYQDVIRDEVNVKAVEPLADPGAIIVYKAKGLVSQLGPKFQKNAGAVKDAIAALPSEQVQHLVRDGKTTVTVPSGPMEVAAEDVEVTTESRPGFSGKKEGGDIVALDTRLTPELSAEGDARELVHKVQNLRKQSGFAVSDRIAVTYRADGALAQAIGDPQLRRTVMDETLATSLEPGIPQGGHQETTEINGKSITISIQQVNQ